MIEVTVRFFAAARDATACETTKLVLAESATIDSLRTKLDADFEALRAMSSHLLFAVGTEYVANNHTLSSGDEVACFPPVSGG